VLAAFGLLVAVTAAYLAWRPVPRFVPDPTGVVRLQGGFHVHSDSSHDGRVSAAEELKGAAELGLDFLVFTEHNKHPEHPSPEGGPLAVPGTELSTKYGHLIYLGLREVPEGGSPLRDGPDLIDSLAAHGALLTVLAHPTSPKRPWNGPVARVGGLEIVSTSADARVKGDPITGILVPLLALPVNSRLALAQLYRRDAAALAIWDRDGNPAMLGFCGLDAHGWLPPRLDLSTWRIVLDPWPEAPRPLTANAVIERLRTGRFFCVAGEFAGAAPRFSFTAATAAGPVPPGRSVPGADAEALEVEAPAATSRTAPVPVTTVLLRDGAEVARTDESTLRFDGGPGGLPAGTYRVELRLPIPDVFFGSHETTVAYSNRIRVTD
jgi:hypothetical protein